MNSVSVAGWLQQIFHEQLLGLAIASTLLCIAGGLATRLAARRSAAVRFCIWQMVGVAVLASALVLWFTSGIPIAGVMADTSPASPNVAEVQRTSRMSVKVQTSAVGPETGVSSAIALPPESNAGIAGHQMPRPIPSDPLQMAKSERITQVSGMDLRELWLIVSASCGAIWISVAGIQFVLLLTSFRRAFAIASHAVLAVPEIALSALQIAQTRLNSLSTLSIRLVVSSDTTVPLTMGILRPMIVLPQCCEAWDQKRMIMVLSHELSHIERRDIFWHLVMKLACCATWFNPLVWRAAGNAVTEREHACDDRVLQSGVAATEYGKTLVEIASCMAGQSPMCAAVVSMAEPPLAIRLRAILATTRRREPVQRGTWFGMATLFIGCSLVLSIVRPLASPVSAQLLPSTIANEQVNAEQATPDLSGKDRRSTTSSKVIKEGRTVRGRILNSNGMPTSAVLKAGGNLMTDVLHSPIDSRLTIDPVWSMDDIAVDGDGEFKIIVPKEMEIYLTIFAAEHAPQRLAVNPDQDNVGDIQLQQGTSLTGALMDRTDKPIAGAVIQLKSVEVVAGDFVSTVYLAALTDAYGQFDLPSCVGECRVWVTDSSSQSNLIGDPILRGIKAPPVVPQSLNLNDKDATQRIRLQEAPTKLVSGTVRWEDGPPASGIDVVASSGGFRLATAKTDANGEYRLNLPTPLSRVSIVIPPVKDKNGIQHWPHGVAKHPARSHEIVMDLESLTNDVPDADWELSVWRNPGWGSPDKSTSHVRGRITSPDGQPVVAQLWVGGPARPDGWTRDRNVIIWKPLAQSATNGKFDLNLDRRELSGEATDLKDKKIRIAATKDGYGFAWADLRIDEGFHDIELKLIEDKPIKGRIVSEDGQPVAGVELTVNLVTAIADDVVLDAVEILENRIKSSGTYTNSPNWPGGSPLTQSVVTDANGDFRIAGIGARRWVSIEARGGGIGDCRLSVLTIDAPVAATGGLIAVKKGLAASQYFSNFTHVAVPGKTIHGVATDKNTGKPIAGIRVGVFESWYSRDQPAITNERGEYEIRDVQRLSDYRIEMTPADASYFRRSLRIKDESGDKPLVVDAQLHAGIEIRGKVSDAATGVAVGGTVEYSALYGNKYVDELAEPRVAVPLSSTTIGTDGTFEIAVLPGPGAILVKANQSGFESAPIEATMLHKLLGDIKLQFQPDENGEYSWYPSSGGKDIGGLPIDFAGSQHVELINPKMDDEAPVLDVTLTHAELRRGTILDSNGAPIFGVVAIGLGSSGTTLTKLEFDEFEIEGLRKGRTRILHFVHPEHNQGTRVVVTGDESTPVIVRLTPTGTISGRLLDKEGEPLKQAQLSLSIVRANSSIFDTGIWNGNADQDGHFTISGLIPDCKYSLRGDLPEEYGPFRPTEFTVQSGETVDLGGLTQKNQFRFERTNDNKSP